MDRDTAKLISLWIHVPIVTAWIGFVMFDVIAAAAPGLSVGQRARMIGWSRPFVIVAVAVIMATGIWQTMENPLLRVTSWTTLEQLRERTYGLALFWKHGFVLITFGLTVLVRFLLTPRLAARAAAGDGGGATPTDELQRGILWLSAINLAACAGALLLTTLMVFQLH